jgi:hypothetical protein
MAEAGCVAGLVDALLSTGALVVAGVAGAGVAVAAAGLAAAGVAGELVAGFAAGLLPALSGAPWPIAAAVSSQTAPTVDQVAILLRMQRSPLSKRAFARTST